MATPLSRRSFLALASSGLIAACGGSATKRAPTAVPVTETPLPTPIPPSPTPEPETLRRYGDKLGWTLGSEIPGWALNDRSWAGIFAREFNLGVIDWGINWSVVEPQQNQFEFAVANQQLAIANQAKARVRAHALVFPGLEIPDWVKQRGTSRADLSSILSTHISGVMSGLKAKVSEWVVVNEADAGRNDLFFSVIGPTYIDRAFQVARDSDPSAVLIYNDTANHSASAPNPNTTKQTREIVTRLKAQGLIDAVGLQMHLDGARPPEKLDVIRTMQSYGVPVSITEFDVNLRNVPGTQDERLSKQADVYRAMLEAAIESGVCKSFTVWSFGDQYSWIERSPSYEKYSPVGDPTPFDDNLRPKPAYYAMLSVLKNAAQGR